MGNNKAKASAKLDVRDLVRSMPAANRQKFMQELWAETMPGQAPPSAPSPLTALPGWPTKPAVDFQAQVAPIVDIHKPPPVSFPQSRVTCVLPVADPKHLKLARQAVNAFVAQTYANKRLLIVNAMGQPVTTHPHPEITEVQVNNPGSVGAMRNIAFTSGVQTDFWCQWDDDDYSVPTRLSYQMAYAGLGIPCVFRRQVRVNLHTATAFIHDDPAGIDRTLLFPDSTRKGATYQPTSDREDTRFLMHTWQGQRVVIDNPIGGGASVVTAFYYRGSNVSDETTWMGRYAGERYHRRSGVEHPFDQQAMAWALKLYGFTTQITTDGSPGKEAVPAGQGDTPVGVTGML